MTNQDILTKMAEQFMEPQVTGCIQWLQLDTPNDGIVSVPASDWTMDTFAKEYGMADVDVEVIVGYGARLSAPGYMDCTEWSVFDTVSEAEQYLVDTYGDDIQEDEDNGPLG